MTNRKELDELRSVPLFAGLQPHILTALLKSSGTREYAAASHLIRQGEKGASVLIIQQGTVSVTVEIAGKAVEIAQLGPGSLLGEISLFCGVPHTADVIATSPVKALQIPHDVFWQAIKSDPASLRAIIRLLAERVRLRSIPLAYLSFAAQGLIDGSLDPDVLSGLEGGRQDEISHFADVFESMVRYVTTRTQQLEAAVEERSQELLREIARRKAAEDELRRQASLDPLTGARNRRSFLQLAERELRRSRRYRRPLSLLMLDIDHFKRINDRHGHAVGDEALKRLAATCQTILREHDVFARLGGEEFVVLLPECAGEMAERVADRLRQALAAVSVTDVEERIGFTVSIGVADCSELSLEDALDLADKAMYAAKRAGRNRVARAAD